MSRWFRFFLLVLGAACSPSVPQTVIPSPTAEASSTPLAAATATQTLTPTPVPTPLGGGSGNLLLLDGPSLYRLNSSTGAEMGVAGMQDLLPPEIFFDAEDSFYSASFSPDAQTLLLILHARSDETYAQAVLARSDGSRSIALPLDLRDRLASRIVWAPDSSGLIVRLSEKFFTDAGPEHWVVSARPEDFGRLLRWERALALFWSGDAQRIYAAENGGTYSVAMRDGSHRTAIRFTGDSCGGTRFGVAAPDGEQIYLMCGFESILEADSNGEDARSIDIQIHPESEVIYWSSSTRSLVISNGAVWSAFPQVTVYDTLRGTSQVATLDEKMTVPCGLSPDGRLFTYLADYFEVPTIRAFDLAGQKTLTMYQSRQPENARQISCPGWLP